MAQASSLTTGNHIAEKQNEGPKKTFKETVAEYLNDTDLGNPKHITATYTTVVLIIISVVTLILETNETINKQYGGLLRGIDTCIMIIFTIEYFLRIWVASGTSSTGPGWRGSLKYITSFYGIVDLIAILPFYIRPILPTNYDGFIRIFRLLRILMLGRYFKSFQIFRRAVLDKKWEIFVSLQAVTVITIILSVLLYEVEHNYETTTPKAAKNFVDIPTTLGWSIAKFVHNAAGLKDFAPATDGGKTIATIIGLLGIAIFAIPAGLVASGFLHEMEEEKRKKDLDGKRKRMFDSFREVENEHFKEKMPRKYITMVQAKSRLNLSEQDIIDVAKQHKGIRLRYKRVNREDVYPSALLIEHYSPDTDYGTCKEGKERFITVISPDSYDDASIGHFSLCLSRQLKAAYISNEIFGSDDSVDPDVACSFSRNNMYLQNPEERKLHDKHPELKKFIEDVCKYTGGGTLAVIIRSRASLPKEGNKENIGQQVYSFGIMGANGITNLIKGINKLEIGAEDSSKEYLSSESKNQKEVSPHLLTAEGYSRYVNDLHYFIAKETRANVLSIYVDPDLLEWVPLDKYYEAIQALANTIENSLSKNGHDLLIHHPENFLLGLGHITGDLQANKHASQTSEHNGIT